MKRIGILTASGNMPALNAMIHGAAMRAKLGQPYHSINTDVHKRIRFLETEAA